MDRQKIDEILDAINPGALRYGSVPGTLGLMQDDAGDWIRMADYQSLLDRLRLVLKAEDLDAARNRALHVSLTRYREHRVAELLDDWHREMDCKTLLEMAFDAAVDRIKQQYINQYEKLIATLRKEVECDTPDSAYWDLRNLLNDFKLKWERGFDGWQDGAELEYQWAVSEHPADLRAAGWVVAVHNDYVLNGKRMTFWLMTKKVEGSIHPLCLKGEGASDREALDQIRQHAFPKEEVADGTTAKQILGEQASDQRSRNELCDDGGNNPVRQGP